MSEFLTIGEAMVLFASTNIDESLVEAKNFQKFVAGAEYNVAVGMTRLGHTVQYVTQLGKDPFGESVMEALKKAKIKTDYVAMTSDYWTGFELKNHVAFGDPDTYYFRRGSAAAHFNSGLVDQIDFRGIKFAHFTGIFPAISAEALRAFKRLISVLQEHNVTISFDPNIRLPLWRSTEFMQNTLNGLAAEADIVLPGISEGEKLMGSHDPEEIADYYLRQSDRTRLVIVKLGPEGSFVKERGKESVIVPGFKVEKVVDTVGAGDGFATGVVSALLEGKSAVEAAIRGNAIGALAVQTVGDSDGYPTKEQLERFLKENRCDKVTKVIDKE